MRVSVCEKAAYADSYDRGAGADPMCPTRKDSPYPSPLLSAATRRRRQGIGAAALVCVGTARCLTGKAIGACATGGRNVMIVVFLLGLECR